MSGSDWLNLPHRARAAQPSKELDRIRAELGLFDKVIAYCAEQGLEQGAEFGIGYVAHKILPDLDSADAYSALSTLVKADPTFMFLGGGLFRVADGVVPASVIAEHATAVTPPAMSPGKPPGKPPEVQAPAIHDEPRSTPIWEGAWKDRTTPIWERALLYCQAHPQETYGYRAVAAQININGRDLSSMHAQLYSALTRRPEFTGCGRGVFRFSTDGQFKPLPVEQPLVASVPPFSEPADYLSTEPTPEPEDPPGTESPAEVDEIDSGRDSSTASCLKALSNLDALSFEQLSQLLVDIGVELRPLQEGLRRVKAKLTDRIESARKVLDEIA